MNRKLRRALEPGFRLYFFVMLVFSGVTAVFSLPVAAAELVAVALMYLLYRRMTVLRRRDILRQIDAITFQVDSAAKDSVVNFPLPILIVRLDSGNIVWSNDHFREISGEEDHLFETHVSYVAPEFSFGWLLEGKSECPVEVELMGRKYKVCGSMTRAGMTGRALLGTFYWLDVTELTQLRQEKMLSAPVVSVILLDNYEECVKNNTEAQKSSMIAAIDERISLKLLPYNGLLRKYDRDRYLFVFAHRYLPQLLDPKNNILDNVREVKNAGGQPVTISVGVGREGASLREQFVGAQLAIDMALSRGGDQIVVKSRATFDFYGGRAREPEKRTKVKARVMANSLTRLMSDSSRVMMMGHKNSDLDSVGAAAGIAALARKLGKPAHMVVDTKRTAAGPVIERLKTSADYRDAFIGAQDALLLLDRDTLLVVVDVNRPELVEAAELLASCNRIAVIDHHRRAADYIDTAALSFHEPYASSASELVCELLQYVLEPGDLYPVEAEALLSGIVLDTKNFQMHTGVRTFEAAAYLRGAGAETTAIKLMFQEELQQVITKGDLVRSAVMVRRQVALAACAYEIDRTIAAQVADELLDVKGVQASFVLFTAGSEVIISARSIGKFNVQVLCEKLGGGGHQTIAGAQVRDEPLDSVLQRLIGVINIYCEENDV